MRSNPVRCDLENSPARSTSDQVQAESVALAEAKRECNRPSCGVAAVRSRTEDAPNIRDGVGLKLLGFDFGALARPRLRSPEPAAAVRPRLARRGSCGVLDERS